MATDKGDVAQKSFDCVAFMRKARSELSEKMNSMSSEEFRHWMRHQKYSDPRLATLAAQRHPGRKDSGCRESEGA